MHTVYGSGILNRSWQAIPYCFWVGKKADDQPIINWRCAFDMLLYLAVWYGAFRLGSSASPAPGGPLPHSCTKKTVKSAPVQCQRSTGTGMQ
jgi:hypothetical protein